MLEGSYCTSLLIFHQNLHESCMRQMLHVLLRTDKDKKCCGHTCKSTESDAEDIINMLAHLYKDPPLAKGQPKCCSILNESMPLASKSQTSN